MTLLVFVIALFFFLALGVPIAIALGSCAITLMFYLDNFDPVMMTQQMLMGVNNFSLMAIPFFMLAGEIMAHGGLSERIVNAANLAVGRIRGGLGYTAILASMLFAGLSGSAVADAAALGAILLPMMIKNGYEPGRATGFICSGAIIAPIIPPSIPMIVLGTSVGLSISRMFMSGIFPGIMLGLALMGAWFFIVRKDGYHDVKYYTPQEAVKILIDSIPALFMPVLIIGGIRLGIFTPTEAGAFAAAYAFIICKFVYKGLNFKIFGDVCIGAVRSTATVMFIVATASAVGWLFTIAQIPAQAVSLLSGLIPHPLALLMSINLFLFAMGMVMDLTPNILIFAPVLFPVIMAAGIDPYFFALIMILNLSIGLITPPVGTVLYVGCGVANIPLARLVKGIMPFLVIELVVLIIFSLVPQLVLVPLKLLM